VKQVHLEADYLPGALLRLEGEAYHHIARVSRVREGEQLRLARRDGGLAESSVVSVDKEGLQLRVDRKLPDEPLSEPLLLGLCSPKGDAFESSLDAATQVGFTVIQPLRSARSPVPAEWVNPSRLARWQKIVLEASDQCQRARLPKMRPPMELADFLKEGQGARWLADPRASQSLASLDASVWRGPQLVIVGPEGGFDEKELALARELGWQNLSLGPGILRTPVAVAALGSWIQQRRSA